MILTAHQPNFVPWYPYFEKIRSADVFVIMTECQWEKNGYQNRFRISDKWMTMAVYRGLEPIRQKKYCDPIVDWSSIRARLLIIHPEWEKTLDDIYSLVNENLLSTNIAIIKYLCNRLEISARIEVDIPTALRGTKRLVELCKWYQCDTYLSGPSGRKYLDESLFDAEGIKIVYQEASPQDKRSVLEVLHDES